MSRINVSTGGIAPYPVRGDIGGALKRLVHNRRSSLPLRDYMYKRIMFLKKLAGE